MAVQHREKGAPPLLTPIDDHNVNPTKTAEDICDLNQPIPDVSRTIYTSVIKRSIDIIVSSVMLFVLSPLIALVIMFVVVDSPGPALFRQTRIGKGGVPFTMYKFRTMHAFKSHQIEWMVDGDGSLRHKIKDDPRLTRVGRWLRRLSLDELPQLFNILRGQMSLIGPRPELPEIVNHYEPWQHRRHLVRPGLTGWWQVNGRSSRPMHENTNLDLVYIEHISPQLDLQILLRTIVVVVRGIGAF